MSRKKIVEGIRITKVGLLYILIALVVGVAAANTGNNALYIVEALLLAVLVLSGLSSRRNVSRLEVELVLPEEVHANEPFRALMRVHNRDRWMARRLVVVEGLADGEALLVPHLPRRARTTGSIQGLVARRGRFRVEFVHLSSVFPFGFFSKGLRIRQEAEMLVFPELFPGGQDVAAADSRSGDRPTNRRGHGHELFNLRRFLNGDDRRGIHWKQTARTGDLVYMEREADSGQRLAIVLDNAVGDLPDEASRQRFESLVSEAATAAHEALRRGFDVELRTRDLTVALAGGSRQRYRIMKELALLAPRPRTREPFGPIDPRVPQLRLAMDSAGRRGRGSHAA